MGKFTSVQDFTTVFKSFLEDRRVGIEFVSNLPVCTPFPRYCDRFFRAVCMGTDLTFDLAVSSAFAWSSSSEGHEFWENVSNEWKRYISYFK